MLLDGTQLHCIILYSEPATPGDRSDQIIVDLAQRTIVGHKLDVENCIRTV